MANQDNRGDINTDPDLESTTPGAGEVEESRDSVDSELVTTRELYLDKLATYINEIESTLQEVNITWDIRPEFYEIGEFEDMYPNNMWDFVDINKLLTHMLSLWRIVLTQTGPDAYAITIEPKKAQLRGLMSGGSTPEEAILNVIWRYLKEIGTERMI